VIANVDEHVIKPCIDRLYYYNMRYSDDPDLKGDVRVQARGAASLMEKEAAQQRRNEFLGVALNSPVAQQVMGMEGVAELLRQAAKTLDLNVDLIVPPKHVVQQKELEMQMQQQMAQEAEMAAQAGVSPNGGTPPAPNGGAELMNGAPVTNKFLPPGA